jgi:hypothetical protein
MSGNPERELAYANSPIKPDMVYKFNYPSEFTALPDYTVHAGQLVLVLRPCTEDEADCCYDDFEDGKGRRCVDLMFKVRAKDGWIGDAWESELE